MTHVSYFKRTIERQINPLLLRALASNSVTLAMLNKLYVQLNNEQKYRFHARYAKIFTWRGVISSGSWTIFFNNKELKLPLRPAWSWLDWDNATSIIGHDIEVKQTYADIVASDQRPALFLDIGANYGTHSVLFLSAGIPTIAFEPNTSCLAHFRTICALNGLKGPWEQVALGSQTGEIELVYPEKDTWLGSVSSDVIPALKDISPVISQTVPLRKLDDYLSEIPRDKILIKIDVEGFENEVIRGANRLMEFCCPKIIFESNNHHSRCELSNLFSDCDYSIYSLPWRPSYVSPCLTMDEFVNSSAKNFIAVPD